MKELALAKVYQLLEPGPVVLLTTAAKGRALWLVGGREFKVATIRSATEVALTDTNAALTDTRAHGDQLG